MSVEWPYAALSKLANKSGGPEKFLALVKSQAFQEGLKAGKTKMIPIILGALGIGVLGTFGIQKYREHKCSKLTKSKATAAEAAEAENLLIKGMKAAKQDEADQ